MQDTVEPIGQPELIYHTDMAVGEILRRTRIHYGRTLQQVEMVLRIRASQLDALEQGDISQLPGRVYAIGFVRSYAEYLGLDGDKMVQLFKEQSGGKQKRPDLHIPAPALESKVPGRAIVAGSIAAVVLLIVLLVIYFLPGAHRNDIPPVPDRLTKSQLNQAPSLVEQAPSLARQPAVSQPATPPQTVAAAPPESRVLLKIIDSSWIEIRDATGNPILRQVLRPGDLYKVPNQPGLMMATGNAGGVTVSVDGKTIGPLGESAQVRRNIRLDPAALLNARPQG